MKQTATNRGMSVVEVILGLVILTISVVAIAYTISNVTQAREQLNSDLKAIYLAEAGYELVRYVRDADWATIDTLPTDTVRYLDVSSSTISITTTPEVIDGEYLRRFHLRPLYRDTNDDIVASTTAGSSIDDESYEVWVEVGGPSGTSTFKGILTNIFAS